MTNTAPATAAARTRAIRAQFLPVDLGHLAIRTTHCLDADLVHVRGGSADDRELAADVLSALEWSGAEVKRGEGLVSLVLPASRRTR